MPSSDKDAQRARSLKHYHKTKEVKKEKRRAYFTEYYQINRQVLSIKKKAFYKKNRDRILKRLRERKMETEKPKRARHKTDEGRLRENAQKREYYKLNKDKQMERNKVYRKKNPERCRAYDRDYYLKNKERIHANMKARREAIRQNGQRDKGLLPGLQGKESGTNARDR